jgi:uncharacterized protein YndB with AHSA1/START domain
MTTQSAYVKVTTPGDRDMYAEREFNAPLERVWAAYTQPELLKQWWARGNELDVVTWEFRKGGHWRFVEHADGQSHGFEGRFREITEHERLVYSFEWDGMPAHVIIEHVEFIDLGDGRTKISYYSQFHTPEERDGMAESGMEIGMNESLAALDRLLAAS